MWWKKPVQRPRRATEGRFEVLKTETTLVLRGLSAPSRWRQLCAAPRAAFTVLSIVLLLAFAAFPLALLVAHTETISPWPWVVFVVLGVAAALVELVRSLGGRVHDKLPYRWVRRTLSIEAQPETGGHRDAPRRAELVIDGRQVQRDEAMRLALTWSRTEGPRARYHVSIIVGFEIYRVDTLRDREAALALANQIAEALELPLPPAEITTKEVSLLWGGVALVVVLVLALGGLAGAVDWGAALDFTGRVGWPLLFAATLAAVALAVSRWFGVHMIEAVAVEAHRVHDIPPPARTQRRFGHKMFAVCAGALVFAVMKAGPRLAEPSWPRPVGHCWSTVSADFCRADVNGDGVPEVVGCSTSTWGWNYGDALDIASGEYVPWEGSDVERWSFYYCEPPFLTVKHVPDLTSSAKAWIDKDHVTDTSHIEAWSSLHKTKHPLWKVSVKGSVQEVQRANGCALVHSVARDRFHFWSAFSLSSGEPCKTIPEAEIEPAIDAARVDLLHRRPVRNPQTVDGVTYALAEIPGSPSKLTLSASRSEAVLWTTALPARGVEGLPMAVAEGVVVVAATDLRTGGNLRLFGVDAASGRVRYVHRHPARREDRIDMVAAGPVVLVWSGHIAGVVPSSGQVAWITTNE